MCNESTADKAQRMLNSHPALQTPEAAARYARLRAHFLDEHPLLPGAGVVVMGRREEVVTVYDFARWANAAGWALPPELDLGVNAEPDNAVAEGSCVDASPALPVNEAPQAQSTTPISTAKPPTDELRGNEVKRVVLLAMAERWPTVASDIQHAKENGLRAAAKAPGRGMWLQEEALEWAERRGKLRPEAQSLASKSSVFRIR
jgi:hypothetical protein